MKLLFIIGLLCSSAFGAITNLRLIDATSAQLHVGYTAPGTSACTFEVSESTSYTPLVYDVDPALFSGANLDSRVGSIGSGTTTREIVIGKNKTEIVASGAKQGASLSRSLHTSATHYVRVTCGADVATLTTATLTVPVGLTRADAQQLVSFQNYAFPSNNPLQFPVTLDPATGVSTVQSAPAQGWTYGGASTTPFSLVTGSAWAATTGTKTAASQLIDTNYLTDTGVTQGWMYAQIGVNSPISSPRPGASYTVVNSDAGLGLSFTNAAGGTITLPQPGIGGQFTAGWEVDAVNNSSGPFVVTPTLSTINGGSTYTFSSATLIRFVTDGTNWTTAPWRSGAWPGNSSFATTLSSQAISITGVCQDGAANCTGANAQVDVAITRDGQPLYPIRTLTIPTAEGTRTICGDGADPCGAPDVAGDIFTFEALPDGNSFSASPYWKVSDGFIYTGAGCTAGNTNWCFTNLSDCQRLWAGEQLSFNDAVYGDGQVTVYSLNCSASQPSAITSGGYNLTTQIPFGYINGINNNPRYGVLIRKHNAVANTMKINALQWRVVSTVANGFDNGSGGFGKICTILMDSNGFYHCAGGVMGQVFGWKPATGEVRFLGVPYYNPVNLDPNLINQQTFTACKGPNDFLWSDTDPNKFYCIFPSSYPNPALGGTIDGRPVVVEMTYTGNDVAQVPDINNPDNYPRFAATGLVLTPCTTACASTAVDFTPYAQMRRYSAEYTADAADFQRDGAVAVQNDAIIWRALNASQDSPAWYFAIDKSVPAGSQQISSGFPTFRARYSRFCADHTPQSPQGTNNNFFVIESGAKCQLEVTATAALTACNRAGSACSPCPAVTLDGVNYTGRNWCGTINFTSSWDGSWGTQPTGYATGDPVNPNLKSDTCNLRWLDHLQVGDFLQWGSETVKLIQKINALQFVVERGLGTDDHLTSAFHIGDTLRTYCNCMNPDTTLIHAPFNIGTTWFYLEDPHGTASYPDYFQNHGFHQNGFGVTPGYSGRFMDFSSRASVQNINGPGFVNAEANLFGGQQTSCAGNGCDQHPGANNLIAPTPGNEKWLADINVFLFEQTSAIAWVHVAGDIYRWIGSNNLPYRVLDIQGIRGFDPMVNISNPGSDLASAGDGSICIAVLPNECTGGSSPGQIYFKVHALGNQTTCRQAEFYGSMMSDVCIFGVVGASGASVQYRLDPTNSGTISTGTGFRVLGKAFRRYREAPTANIKSDPTGTVLFERTNFYWQTPPWVEDGVERSGFLVLPVPMFNVPAGTSTAKIRFGYTPDFRCTSNYNDMCLATKLSIDPLAPVQWASENPQGAACAAGCTIAIPAIWNKILYFQPEFFNAGGISLGTGALSAQAITRAPRETFVQGNISLRGNAVVH